MTEALKRCPFCGGRPTLRENPPQLFWLSCEDIACTARPKVYSLSKAEAIARWNTRAEQKETGRWAS